MRATRLSSSGRRRLSVEDDVPVIEASALKVGYGGVAVVHGADLFVKRGELVALLGPNGAGKTTTLLALAGVLLPLGGAVLWQGSQTTEPLHARARRGLGLLTDDRGILRSLSGSDNLRLAGVAEDAALALFPELTKKMKLKVGDLSGGEQQMLAVAKLLGRKPALLLADEISLGLAPLIVRRIFTAIRAAVDNDGLSVLLIEQHVRQVIDVADRAYVMSRGSIVADGPAREVAMGLDVLRAAYLSNGTPS